MRVAETQRHFTAKQIVRGFLPYLRPYKSSFIIAGILIVGSMIMDVAKPIVVGKAVDATVGPGGTFERLFPYCLSFLGLIVAEFVLNTTKSYLVQAAGQKITHKLRVDLFARVTHFPVPYYDKNPVGRILTRIVNDIKTLGEVFTASMAVLALDIILILGTVFAMVWLDAKLAVWVLATFPIVLLSIHLFGRFLASAYRQARAKLSEINAFLGENIGAIATIQRLGAQEGRLRKFERIVDEHFKAQMHSLRVYANLYPITNTLNGVAMTTLLLVGGNAVLDKTISLGVLVTFIGYIRNLFIPVRDLVEKYNQLLSARVSTERVLSLLHEPVEMEPLSSIGDIEKEIVGVDFRDVTFTYPSRTAPALKNVTLSLPSGQSLAIVGPTGSGKSTIIRLLLRFYDTDSGQILVGGKPIEDWDRRSLRTQFGVVHQEIYLLQGTLRDNLTLGSRLYPDPYLIEQCQRAQFWEFAKDRGGLDMAIHEGGANLSIGQKQLIAFARILVFDPPVLILDEATASIDRIAEQKLMEATRTLLEGRTSIVIAHRLSTIEYCDQIIEIRDGKAGTFSKERSEQVANHRPAL
ncbi:MAG: ABC transporter ATP-binding protein [Bdellovibrionaceae bacterium]|nr:ABC transporter ATP-binding protein [Bdellovibrionales bacterium]MCB9255471.1 ABC transporter ATP-binding protein [Pseudobdellovibrionaceae bacterium]